MNEKISFDKLLLNQEVAAYLKAADDNFAAIGYKEHGLRHAQLTSSIAGNVLKYLDFPGEEVEKARVAGYLHDMGNAIGQEDHAQNGAIMALDILENEKFDYKDIYSILNAIGSHEDRDLDPSSPVTAAVILGDKTDVNHSRVRLVNILGIDTHARVNFACQRAFLRVNKAEKNISLELTINTAICPLMEYFEIFLSRIKFCRKAAKYLGCNFVLFINNDKFL